MSIPEKHQYDRRKNFLDDLKLLSKPEYEEIFRIIKRGNVPYTENSNGIFFDVLQVSDPLFEQLTNYIILCKTQRFDEESRTKVLTELRNEA